jgi:YD repeat-containing protein
MQPSGPSRRTTGVLAIVAWLVWNAIGVGIASAQQPAVLYVYDDLSRLVGVIDQDGNVATYTYDAVGNILRIDRFDGTGVPGPVAITLVTPARGKVGTAVQIFGKGFSPTAAQDIVAFNGVRAEVNAAEPNHIVTLVPSGAVTGPITVTSPLGSATSAVAFRVPGAIAVSPATLTIFARRTQQFTASEVGNSPASVLWSVNGIAGGNTTVGTISTEGLYTAPSLVPLPPTVTVTATNSEDTRLSATATVTIVTPPDILLAASAVSVQIGPLLASDKNVTASVSVQVSAPAGAVAGGGLAISMGPVVTSVSPATGPRATSGLVLRIVGAELTDASGLAFRLNNVADNTITVTSLVIDPDGEGATATISIAAAAPVGARVLQVLTPASVSTAIGTTGNRFTVQ